MDAALLGQLMAAGLFLLIILFLMSGYLVAFTLGGLAILAGFAGIWAGAFDEALFAALPNRFWGVITNQVLVAVPLFVFMGVVLERSGIAESLLTTMGQVFGSLRGGLALSVVLVGALLAAATGVVGATVVTMGLLSLPAMMRAGYDPKLACGTICAAGTLGQIIPPSTVLIFMADILQGANSAAQLALGNFAPDTVSVGDLFAGALVPSAILVTLYTAYVIWRAIVAPETCPPVTMTPEERAGLATRVFSSLIPPITLIVAVLGSIIAGVATPTESASVGAVGALFLAAIRLLGDEVFGAEGDPRRDGRVLRFWLAFLAALALVAVFFGGAGLLNFMVVVLALSVVALMLNGRMRRSYAETVFRSSVSTMSITSMVFIILLGATAFALVFTQMGGGEMVRNFLEGMPGGQTGALLTVFAIIFVLGFFLDTFEILFIVVPITAPVLLMMGVDPIWLGVMMGVLLQTSFLTPPFGFSLFYLRGVAPSWITTPMIYRGAVPFIALQIVALAVIWVFPDMATWLPNQIFRSDAPGAEGAPPPPPAFDEGGGGEDEFL
jgi:TRAP-type mannitol/chloroaromatic compound transport system permease large subunit